MVLVKTPLGQEAFKDRRGSLTSRQRSAFILFDGKRTVKEVLAATEAMGITQQDVQAMLDQGLLAASVGTAAEVPRAPVAATPDSHGTGLQEPTQTSDRTSQQRYEDAYPVAAQLTASLGLRGFRLNLAVEGAGSYEDLAALAPRIREAVGDAKYAALAKALFS